MKKTTLLTLPVMALVLFGCSATTDDENSGEETVSAPAPTPTVTVTAEPEPAPTVTVTATPAPKPVKEKKPYGELDELAAEMAWDSQDAAGKESICFLFNSDREMAMDLFAEGAEESLDSPMVLAAEALFDREC